MIEEKKKPKKLDPKKRFVADVSRDDIIRIMKANKEDLTVKEEKIRKLINKKQADHKQANFGKCIFCSFFSLSKKEEEACF